MVLGTLARVYALVVGFVYTGFMRGEGVGRLMVAGFISGPGFARSTKADELARQRRGNRRNDVVSKSILI